MAFSTCAKCGGTFFELKTVSPSGSAYKQNFVQCSTCGAPVGVVDYFNTGTLIDGLKKQLAQVQSSLSDVAQRLSYLEQHIRQLR